MICARRLVASIAAVLLSATLTTSVSAAQVSGQATVTAANSAVRGSRDARVVLWLTPLDSQAITLAASHRSSGPAQLVQKNKTFIPHILAVQIGSRVDFPNHDPFFHNVFSLFNGKRFDLGLYEAGSTRGVHFDRAGICYIFCNIHPQMSAIVVVVDTPYYSVSDGSGGLSIPEVPAGRYQTHYWEDRCSAATLDGLSRPISVGDAGTSLGNVHLQESEQPVTSHLNKYGKQYDPDVFSSPIYVQP